MVTLATDYLEITLYTIYGTAHSLPESKQGQYVLIAKYLKDPHPTTYGYNSLSKGTHRECTRWGNILGQKQVDGAGSKRQ